MGVCYIVNVIRNPQNPILIGRQLFAGIGWLQTSVPFGLGLVGLLLVMYFSHMGVSENEVYLILGVLTMRTLQFRVL